MYVWMEHRFWDSISIFGLIFVEQKYVIGRCLSLETMGIEIERLSVYHSTPAILKPCLFVEGVFLGVNCESSTCDCPGTSCFIPLILNPTDLLGAVLWCSDTNGAGACEEVSKVALQSAVQE